MKNNGEDFNIKIDFYIISLWLLFLFVIILAIDFGSILELNKDYTSWVNFVKKNAVALIKMYPL